MKNYLLSFSETPFIHKCKTFFCYEKHEIPKWHIERKEMSGIYFAISLLQNSLSKSRIIGIRAPWVSHDHIYLWHILSSIFEKSALIDVHRAQMIPSNARARREPGKQLQVLDFLYKWLIRKKMEDGINDVQRANFRKKHTTWQDKNFVT